MVSLYRCTAIGHEHVGDYPSISEATERAALTHHSLYNEARALTLWRHTGFRDVEVTVGGKIVARYIIISHRQ